MRLFLLLFLLPLAAYATDKKPDPIVKAEASAEAAASADAAASAEVGDVSQSLNVQDRKQAPAVLAPSIAPTAPCYYSVSGGLSLAGIGGSGGKAIKDDACELREEIRLAFQIGLVGEAYAMFCSGPGLELDGCGRLTAPAPPVEPAPAVIVLQGDGCGQRYDEKLKRVLDRCAQK